MQIVPTAAPLVPQDLGDTIRASLTGAFSMFFASMPRILALLVILLIGWFVASLLAKAVGRPAARRALQRPR